MVDRLFDKLSILQIISVLVNCKEKCPMSLLSLHPLPTLSLSSVARFLNPQPEHSAFLREILVISDK